MSRLECRIRGRMPSGRWSRRVVFGLSGESTEYGFSWCACMPVDFAGGTGRIDLRVEPSNSVRTPNGCLARRVSVGLPGVTRIAGLSGIAVSAGSSSGQSAGREDAMRNRIGARVSLDGNIQDDLGRCRASLRTDQHHRRWRIFGCRRCRFPEAFGPGRHGNGRFSEHYTFGYGVPGTGRVHGPRIFGSGLQMLDFRVRRLKTKTVHAGTSSGAPVAELKG